jgi:hypothetical protein
MGHKPKTTSRSIRAWARRALKDDAEYVLPARFDDSEAPGISPNVHYISLADKSPAAFGKFILKKLGR